VILIGEIRDKETMEAAINLSGAGHLVLSTHTPTTAQRRWTHHQHVPQDQRQIFLDLSQYPRAILSQRLVVGKDGKRIAAIQVMLNAVHHRANRRATSRRSRKLLLPAPNAVCRASTWRC
jgi:twitching motility protein PilU